MLMKRLLLPLALAWLTLAANAQTVGEVTDSVKQAVKHGNLKKKVKTIKGAFASKAAEAHELVGTWIYVKPTVLATSGNIFVKTIGNTYADNLEELIDSYFEKANVTPQNTSVVFNENGTFSRSVADRKANGTWMVNGDQVLTAIKNIQFGCMTSRLENDTLTLVVPVKRIMTALQELGGISDSKTNTTIVKLTKHLKGFQAGFLLTRKKK